MKYFSDSVWTIKIFQEVPWPLTILSTRFYVHLCQEQQVILIKWKQQIKIPFFCLWYLTLQIDYNTVLSTWGFNPSHVENITKWYNYIIEFQRNFALILCHPLLSMDIVTSFGAKSRVNMILSLRQSIIKLNIF